MAGAAVPFVRLPLRQDGFAAGWAIPGDMGLEWWKGPGGEEDGQGSRELD